MMTLDEQDQLMTERNLQGIDLEHAGHTEEAVILYEANLRLCFIGSHPYERLRIIYGKRNDYSSAIRVCKAYLNLPERPADMVKRQRFMDHLDTLTRKMAG